MPKTTNPAAELYALCIQARKTNPAPRAPNQKPSVREGLNALFGTENSETLFLAIIATISARFDRLIKIIHQTNLPDDLNNRALSAISQLRQLFSYRGGAWDDLRTNLLREEHLTALQFVSHTVASIATISVPTEDERANIIKSIDEVVDQLQSEFGVEVDALLSSLKALRLVLEKLPFFGTSELIEKLTLSNTIYKATRAKARGPKKLALDKAAVVICAVANLLIVQDSLLTAIGNDYARSQTVIKYIAEYKAERAKPKLLPSPPKQIGHQKSSAEEPTDSPPLVKEEDT